MPVRMCSIVWSNTTRHLLVAGDQVVVVLDRGEGQQRRELRHLEVDAGDLVDRHQPALELRPLDPLLEVAHHQLLVELLLLGEAGGVDGLEALQELARLGEVGVDGGLGGVGELVVPALVAEDRGELRRVGEGVLPLLGEELVEGVAPRLEIGREGGAAQSGGRRPAGGWPAEISYACGGLLFHCKAPSIRRKAAAEVTGPGRCLRHALCGRASDVEQNREEVENAAGEHEQMPDGVVVRQPAPDVEDDAQGVGDARRGPAAPARRAPPPRSAA